MSLPDTIFIFGLALVIFGPKKLPEIGRQLGKLVLEFRRASNEFKMQIEEELRAAEVADRQKQIAAPPATPASEPVSRSINDSAPEQRDYGQHGKPVLASDPGGRRSRGTQGSRGRPPGTAEQRPRTRAGAGSQPS